MHENVLTTSPGRLADLSLLTEETANKNSSKPVSWLLSATLHRQEKICGQAYLVYSSTLLLPASAITAPTHSYSATH